MQLVSDGLKCGELCCHGVVDISDIICFRRKTRLRDSPERYVRQFDEVATAGTEACNTVISGGGQLQQTE